MDKAVGKKEKLPYGRELYRDVETVALYGKIASLPFFTTWILLLSRGGDGSAVGYFNVDGNAPSGVEGYGRTALRDHERELVGGVRSIVDVVLGLVVNDDVGVVFCAVYGDDAVALYRSIGGELDGNAIGTRLESVDAGLVSVNFIIALCLDVYDGLYFHLEATCRCFIRVVGYVVGEPSERNGAEHDNADQNACYGDEKALSKRLVSYLFFFCLEKVFQESTSSRGLISIFSNRRT